MFVPGAKRASDARVIYLMTDVGQRVVRDIRNRLFRHILGQSAATAAVLAMDAGLAVQDLPYAKLRERLLKDGQVLEHSSDVFSPTPER